MKHIRNKNIIVYLIGGLCLLLLIIIPISYSWSSKELEYKLVIQDIKIKENNGISYFSANIYNHDKNDILINSFELIILDKNNQEIFREPIYIGDVIKGEDNLQINFETTKKIKDYYKVTYRLGS